uniref:Uncharacterized protein n=1 Tax=Arundo donax TaxID=35708 RepID=A0A0A9GJ75_ARUDO
MLILTVPFKFDIPSPDDMVTTSLINPLQFNLSSLIHHHLMTWFNSHFLLCFVTFSICCWCGC